MRSAGSDLGSAGLGHSGEFVESHGIAGGAGAAGSADYGILLRSFRGTVFLLLVVPTLGLIELLRILDSCPHLILPRLASGVSTDARVPGAGRPRRRAPACVSRVRPLSRRHACTKLVRGDRVSIELYPPSDYVSLSFAWTYSSNRYSLDPSSCIWNTHWMTN